MKYTVSIVAVLLLAGATSLLAQSTISGFVTGTVLDPSKAVVRGARVTLYNPATSQNLDATTNEEGVFHFDYVPPGTYTLSVSVQGFNGFRESVTAKVGQSTTADVQLSVGTSTTVEVTSEASPLQTENADVSTNYEEREIQIVPNPGQDLIRCTDSARRSDEHAEWGREFLCLWPAGIFQYVHDQRNGLLE